ncbi:hypothetical protein [Thermasporomyces composti]|uniref:hypothetical protein n=1 Tax=Thermasporomyces composti TaxID=696763 RepID=UPI0011C0246D|nr:hypothetical protein [Thermasporomyces composti]
MDLPVKANALTGGGTRGELGPPGQPGRAASRCADETATEVVRMDGAGQDRGVQDGTQRSPDRPTRDPEHERWTGAASRPSPRDAHGSATSPRWRVQRLGSLLPSHTTEDRLEAWGDWSGDDDERLLREVPPHHGT